MKQVVISNPIINSPFDEPTRHFQFDDEGITEEIVAGRRSSIYFMPIAQAKKKGSKQKVFDTEWTRDRIEENRLVNQIREHGLQRRELLRPPRLLHRHSGKHRGRGRHL